MDAYDFAAQHPRANHKTVPLQVWADIDEGIVDLVRELNSIEGVRTDASCQGDKGYRPYVMATWPKSVEPLLREKYDIELLGESWGYVRPRILPQVSARYDCFGVGAGNVEGCECRRIYERLDMDGSD